MAFFFSKSGARSGHAHVFTRGPELTIKLKQSEKSSLMKFMNTVGPLLDTRNDPTITTREMKHKFVESMHKILKTEKRVSRLSTRQSICGVTSSEMRPWPLMSRSQGGDAIFYWSAKYCISGVLL